MRRLAKIVQIVEDLAPKPLTQIRLLDLASLTGSYSLEFAARGCREVIGIEGRASNVAEAEARRQSVGLNNVRFIVANVNDLSRETAGTFDVVLVLGILYHLTAEDAARLVAKVFEVCDGFAIFDTHFSLTPEKTTRWNGAEYAGRNYLEPADDERPDSPWASIENPTSFWFTKPSLFNLISRAGFTTVYECAAPYLPPPEYPVDRTILIAFKGPVTQPVMPDAQNLAAVYTPESVQPIGTPHSQLPVPLWRSLLKRFRSPRQP